MSYLRPSGPCSGAASHGALCLRVASKCTVAYRRCEYKAGHTSKLTASDRFHCGLSVANKMLEYKVCNFIHCFWRALCELISPPVLGCFFSPTFAYLSLITFLFPCFLVSEANTSRLHSKNSSLPHIQAVGSPAFA